MEFSFVRTPLKALALDFINCCVYFRYTIQYITNLSATKMADEQSITFPEMSSKLERCCLAVAKARREQEEAEASHRAHQQQRLELERRMEEDRC